MTMIRALIGALASLFIAQAAFAQDAPERPNILWIIAEDMGPEQGHYGEPQARTPHMDALAARGMVFENAFSTAPICSISRSAFMTGMHSITIGAHQHRTPRDRKHQLPEGVQLMTHRLTAAGYTTALVEQLGKPGETDAYKGSRKTDWNFTVEGKPYQLNDFNALSGNQPFFAQVQFQETHRGGHWDHASEMVPHPADPAKVDLPPYYPDTPTARREWAKYLDNVALFDMKLGYVLQRLEEEGLADNTVVIAFADHGRAMPRAKQFLWDSGLHVPLIVYWPEGLTPPAHYAPGRSDRLVSLIDVTATTLAAAGVEMPLLMQGKPIFGPEAYFHQYLFGARDRADETYIPMRTVRDARFRYIRNLQPEIAWSAQNRYKERSYPILREMFRMQSAGTLTGVPAIFMADARPAEELYDTLADPHNVNNLANDPAYAAPLLRLSAALDAWMASANDQGRFPELPAIAQFYANSADEKFAEDVKAVLDSEGPWR